MNAREALAGEFAQLVSRLPSRSPRYVPEPGLEHRGSVLAISESGAHGVLAIYAWKDACKLLILCLERRDAITAALAAAEVKRGAP